MQEPLAVLLLNGEVTDVAGNFGIPTPDSSSRQSIACFFSSALVGGNFEAAEVPFWTTICHHQ